MAYDYLNDTSQFDLARKRATDQSAVNIQTQRDALKRRFANLGNLDSGAQTKIEQKAVDSENANLNNSLEGVQAAQNAEMGRRQEVIQGQNFTAGENQKTRDTTKYGLDLADKQAGAALDEEKWVNRTTADLNERIFNKEDPFVELLKNFFGGGGGDGKNTGTGKAIGDIVGAGGTGNSVENVLLKVFDPTGLQKKTTDAVWKGLKGNSESNSISELNPGFAQVRGPDLGNQDTYVVPQQAPTPAPSGGGVIAPNKENDSSSGFFLTGQKQSAPRTSNQSYANGADLKKVYDFAVKTFRG